MTERIGALAVEKIDLATTFDPLPGVIMQLTCAAPSGMRSPLPPVWFSMDAARGLQRQLTKALQRADSNQRPSARRRSH